jgi:acyl-coenzyme A thioesterase PaaI-like protein
VGLYQGGFLAAALDEVFGPLSYVSSGSACMTLSLNTTYLGAFKEDMGHCMIEAKVLKKTKNFIFMRADVYSPNGDLIAHSESHVKVV